MSTLRAFLVLIVTAVPGLAGAVPSSATERAMLFASCAGSFAAEAEHLRLVGGGATLDAAQDHVRLFASLLEAVVTDEMRTGETAIRLRAVRAEARLIQRDLLTAATYAAKPDHRAPAQHAALRRRAMCEALLLGG